MTGCRSWTGALHRLLWVIACLAVPAGLDAQGLDQNQTGDGPPRRVAVLRAGERTAEVHIDGRFDEDAWAQAPAASGFVQGEPVEGGQPPNWSRDLTDSGSRMPNRATKPGMMFVR